MSDASGNGGGRKRVDDALAARRRADLVSGLRGLARRPGAGRSRRDVGTGAGSDLPAGATPGNGSAAADAADETDERCELCGASLPTDHRHLLHLDERRMLCACETCWSVRSGDPSFRPAGVRIAWLDDLEIPDEAWAGFRIPIGLAFFMRTTAGENGSGAERVVAFYPSPAGATESEIDAGAWQRLERLEPELAALEPDCEALIVNRIGEPHRHVIAPIDECYRLVGMIKSSWEGISGGSGTEEAIERFFTELRVRSATMSIGDG